LKGFDEVFLICSTISEGSRGGGHFLIRLVAPKIHCAGQYFENCWWGKAR